MTRISKGAKQRARRQPGHYYAGDMKTQARMLRVRIAHLNQNAIVQIDVDAAIRRMVKRVSRFYGLTNKYPPKQES